MKIVIFHFADGRNVDLGSFTAEGDHRTAAWAFNGIHMEEDQRGSERQTWLGFLIFGTPNLQSFCSKTYPLVNVHIAMENHHF